MADVTGTIGNEYVELNNAATEATLKQLLAAVKAQGGLGAAGKAAAMAGAAGMDPNAVKAANEGLKQTAETGKQNTTVFRTLGTVTGNAVGAFTRLDGALSPLIAKFIKGEANASDMFGAMEKLPGLLGIVATQFRRLAAFQEENFRAYQGMSDAGVNFAGSLTDMRMAASNTYMTLDQFGKLMKNNSELFAKLGGTANQGAMAFTRMSNELLKSGAGDNLRSLGYTTEQVNQGMANYLAASGGRNRQEMQNTAAVTKGAAEYLTQLDALATITGKSREEQEKQLKEANANAAYEAYLQTLDEEGKKKATLAMQNALATGGKAGADVLKSQLLGLPPMTEAAQKLTALGPNVTNGIKQMGDAVQDTRKTTQDVNRGYTAAQAGATQDMQKFGKTASALSFGTDSTSQALMGLQASANRNKQQGIANQADADRQLREVTEEQKQRQASQAAEAAKTEKAMQEIGQALMSMLLPAVKLLTPVVNFLAQTVSTVVK